MRTIPSLLTIPICVAVLVAALAGCYGRERAAAADEPTVSERTGSLRTNTIGVPQSLEPMIAPPFERVTMQGETFRTEDHRGRVMLVNFWATWCAPCVREIPDLIALNTALADSGLTIVGVSLDHEGFDVIRPFAKRFNPTYPIVLEEGLAEQFPDVRGLPVTFIIDRDGRIVSRVDGLAKPGLLRKELNGVLADGIAS